MIPRTFSQEAQPPRSFLLGGVLSWARMAPRKSGFSKLLSLHSRKLAIEYVRPIPTIEIGNYIKGQTRKLIVNFSFFNVLNI